MEKKIILILIIVSIFCYSAAQAATPSEYLILQSIGAYHSSGKGKCGPGAGFLGAAGHFNEDHNDATCRTGYYNSSLDLAVSIQVAQHTGIDSDKWLLHELDSEIRDYYGVPDLSFTIKIIDSNVVFVFSSGGRDYRWLSGSKVVRIEYTDLMMEKSEPLAVVKAYLAKHPSTLPSLTLSQLRSADNKTKWIKDEMDRRLWLCDKWFSQTELLRTDQKKILQEQVKSMKVFVDYREKYFEIAAKDEKNLLRAISLSK